MREIFINMSEVSIIFKAVDFSLCCMKEQGDNIAHLVHTWNEIELSIIFKRFYILKLCNI